jgi:RimJ/RimL family protein N-acetyltransferase
MTSTLAGNNLCLSVIRKEDLPLLTTWRNSDDVRLNCREHRLLSDVHQDRWFEKINSPESKDYMFLISRKSTIESLESCPGPFGVVGMTHCDFLNGNGEISFYLGSQDFRGKGIAREALGILIDWTFDELRLKRIHAEVYVYNLISKNLLESLGFKEEGRMRASKYRFGKYNDSWILGLLEEDWKAIK